MSAAAVAVEVVSAAVVAAVPVPLELLLAPVVADLRVVARRRAQVVADLRVVPHRAVVADLQAVVSADSAVAVALRLIRSYSAVTAGRLNTRGKPRLAAAPRSR
jgi:hypothetical protein